MADLEHERLAAALETHSRHRDRTAREHASAVDTSSIENVVQLRAVIAAGTVAMDKKHYQQRFNAQALD